MKHKHQYDTPVIVYATFNITGRESDNSITAFPCAKCSICGHMKRVNGLYLWGLGFDKIEDLPDCELIEGINNVPKSFCKCKDVYEYFINWTKEEQK